MATQTIDQGVPPEKTNIATGKTTGNGPVGFSAALLPFLQKEDARAIQRQRVADNYPGADAYYSAVLTFSARDGINTVSASPPVANYGLTGTRNAQVLTKLIHPLLGVALMPLAHAATTPVQEHLLEQVRLGEASKREDLVRQSLYRLN